MSVTVVGHDILDKFSWPDSFKLYQDIPWALRHFASKELSVTSSRIRLVKLPTIKVLRHGRAFEEGIASASRVFAHDSVDRSCFRLRRQGTEFFCSWRLVFCSTVRQFDCLASNLVID